MAIQLLFDDHCDFSLGGIKQLYLSTELNKERPYYPLDYTISGYTMTDILDTVTFTKINITDEASMEQVRTVDDQGKWYDKTLTFSISKISLFQNRWLNNMLFKRNVSGTGVNIDRYNTTALFEDMNGNWWIAGYDVPFLVEDFSLTTGDLEGENQYEITMNSRSYNRIRKIIGNFDCDLIEYPSTFSASGGTVYDFNGYRFHLFTGSSIFQVYGRSNSNIEYLIVAGGGAGGYARSGGGGAGGLLHNFTGSPITVNVGSHSIIVGTGGTGNLGNGTNGGNSSAFGLIAIGGGACNAGGGSGGGGSFASVGGAGTAGQGKNGGDGNNSGASNRQGGGGGGAGEEGEDASSNNAGDGGDGLNMSAYVGTFVGEAGWFAGGGGGGSQSGTLGTGGLGGGATPINSIGANGVAGLPNTGGGGSSTREAFGSRIGGNGGSGVVIIRYPIQ